MAESTEKLWSLAQREGIFIKWFDLHSTPERLWGMYYYDPCLGLPVIVLDSMLSARPRLLRCVLAEELGHHFTVPATDTFKLRFSYSDGVMRGRDEARAMRWATRFLIPEKEFNSLASALSVPELAEHFDVTEEFIKWTIQFNGNLRTVGQGQNRPA